MIPWESLDSSEVPGDGGIISLYKRGDEFSIRINNHELMNSRLHGSEDALAVLSCKRVAEHPGARVLIGGLGLGFTLAAALRVLHADAFVEVAELVPAVILWNQGPLAHIADYPLEDRRVIIKTTDVALIIRNQNNYFDAILLDVDNGPEGLTHKNNNTLYSAAGLAEAYAALRPGGILAVWSAGPDQAFAKRLGNAGFSVNEQKVHARSRGKGSRHIIWLASRN
ncbi:MAG: hypothetical protein ISR96_00135 [Nitrospira sp.]|nr:hypothetical protein [bacterium]MBL7047923.1 hypothetical protein [Nitrospira sp.]